MFVLNLFKDCTFNPGTETSFGEVHLYGINSISNINWNNTVFNFECCSMTFTPLLASWKLDLLRVPIIRNKMLENKIKNHMIQLYAFKLTVYYLSWWVIDLLAVELIRDGMSSTFLLLSIRPKLVLTNTIVKF